MAPSGEAEGSADYYELLGISNAASESEIRRAYRKTSLLYHPDKVKSTPETVEKFQLLQVALNILTDADEKLKYDKGREAKLRRKAENEALEGRRRKMKEDLETRERNMDGTSVQVGAVNGAKRSWSERELEIKRIAEENRKRREAMVRERAKAAKEAEADPAPQQPEEPADAMERSVKVRWIREGDGVTIDDDWLHEAFEQFGDVENVALMKDRKKRIDGRDKKVLFGTALVVFGSLTAAKKAVANGPWDKIESISMAAEKELEPS